METVETMKTEKTPKWLVIVLVVLAVVLAGPPLLGLLLGAVGIALGLAALAAKLAVLALIGYGIYMFLRGLFGPPRPAQLTSTTPMTADGVNLGEPLDVELERTRREEKAELDRELERAIEEKKRRGA